VLLGFQLDLLMAILKEYMAIEFLSSTGRRQGGQDRWGSRLGGLEDIFSLLIVIQVIMLIVISIV
jgi:hypothetical protein